MRNTHKSSDHVSEIYGMTEDEMLMKALQESADLHQATICGEICTRTFEAVSQSGIQLLQMPILNQFHPQWNPLISKYGTASAICGYTAIACARYIAELDPLSMTKKELQDRLCSFSSISGLVGDSMQFIQESRKAYIDKHLENFDPKSQESYMKAWVANFEISDYLRHGCPASERPKIIFVRFNQYPVLDLATHDEHDRISAFECGFEDSQVLVETFFDSDVLPTRPHLHRPTEMPNLPPLRAAVVDVSGHFACATVCKDGGVLFNTLDVSYIHFPGGESTAVALMALSASQEEGRIRESEQEHAAAMSIFQQSGGVSVMRHRGQGCASPDYTLSFFRFNTFLADVKLCQGCFYFEVEVVQVGPAVQFGVVTEGFMPRADPMGLGVGDCGASWGVCGIRQLKWQAGESSSFGSTWSVGDVIGFLLDMRTVEAAALSISVNGSFAAPNGPAFTDIDAPYLSPAFSGDGRFRLNFGDRPFAHPPDCAVIQYKSVHDFHRLDNK